MSHHSRAPRRPALQSVSMLLNLTALARRGAIERLRIIDAERAAILKAFPDLTGTSVVPVRTRTRRKMSAAGKAAIGAAAKRRWAEWRKKQRAKES